MTSAIETDRHAAHGPRMMAISVAPTACPVEPPMTGTLNIMITNENAAPSAMSGTCLVLRVFFTLAEATAQIGTMATSSTAYVCGPRYPSGMCISKLPLDMTAGRGHDELAVLDAFGAEQPVGDRAHVGAPSSDDDDFEAVVGVEVDVHRRDDLVVMCVL